MWKNNVSSANISGNGQTNSLRHSPLFVLVLVAEEVVGRQLDGLLRRDEHDVDRRAAVHAEVALGAVRLPETVQPGGRWVVRGHRLPVTGRPSA